MPDGRLMANTWQGQFPHQHDRPDAWLGTSPVKTYPANGIGIHDMAGNVWEWTDDSYETSRPTRPCCGPEPGGHIPLKVVKGGSHLCAPNYCLRYRPAARQGEAIDTSTGHIGFRCIIRAA